MSTQPHHYSPQHSAEEALRAIFALFEPNDVIEIRALNVGGTARSSGVTMSGYFNMENGGAIARAIEQLGG